MTKNKNNAKKQPIEEQSSLRQQLTEWETAQMPLCPDFAFDTELPFDFSIQNKTPIPPHEGKFKSIVENSLDAIICFDKELQFLYANLIAIEIIGMPLLTALGKNTLKPNINNKYCNVWKRRIAEVFRSKQQTVFESEFINYKGYHFYYQARLFPEFSPDGKVISVICTLRDIGELKKIKLDLQASEERNEKFLSSLPDFIFYLTNEGIYLDCHITNPHLLYKPHSDRIGKHVSEVLPASQAQQIMTKIKRTIKSGKMQILEYQLTINETICFLEGRIITYNSESVLVIVRDITELKHLKLELTRLDQLNLVGKMAATIGHEVRNPMTTVRGFLQFLAGKEAYINLKEYFDLMIEELDRANSIINDFLSLAKNKEVKLETQNLNTIIKAIAPLLQSNAIIANKALHLDLNTIPDLSLDSQEIRQLILNMVHNSLEAMPPHTHITIKSFMENDQVVLAIQDEGTGIPPEYIAKLGTPFFTTKETGTGLGLAVCYSIAARHKATIEIDTGSHGTTFFIKFNL